MPEAPAALLTAWHDFFMLIGAAAATLIGAMFVVVSIGTGLLTRDRAVAIRTFLTSTVTHLSTTLLGSAVTLLPGLDWFWLGAAASLAGLGGMAYSAWVLAGFRQHSGTVASDWLWYVALPLLAYATLLATAATAWRGSATSLDLLAGSLGFLLIAGIRNAWDMIVFFVTAERDPT